MVLKSYDIIQKAVEEGIEYGWNRAHKNGDMPSKEILIENLINNVMLSLDEVINFELSKFLQNSKL